MITRRTRKKRHSEEYDGEQSEEQPSDVEMAFQDTKSASGSDNEEPEPSDGEEKLGRGARSRAKVCMDGLRGGKANLSNESVG